MYFLNYALKVFICSTSVYVYVLPVPRKLANGRIEC